MWKESEHSSSQVSVIRRTCARLPEARRRYQHFGTVSSIGSADPTMLRINVKFSSRNFVVGGNELNTWSSQQLRDQRLEPTPKGSQRMASTEWIGLSAQVITSVAALGAFVVALIALRYARGQVVEAQAQLRANVQDAEATRKLQRDLMIEQAQPYVAVTIERDADNPLFVELVVKNYGTSAAKNVRIVIDPPPMSAALGEPSNPVALNIPEVISVLAPSQEWRTLWDSGKDRPDSGLPDKHKISVSYIGLTSRPMHFSATLDWGFFRGVIYAERKGMHHLATTASNMEKQINKVIDGRYLSVLTRDGLLQDAKRTAEMRAWQKRHPKPGGSRAD